MSVAFKNAMIGGIMLGLIEGVSVLFTSIQMRRQFEYVEQMQKEELQRMAMQ